ncbi:MAG TPA: helix-turn-helix transcriptional regulator [Desulfatiglandales bacterium]|nr:helix-turn-helix transcriptional regulator [Desulfatiglandales bacterium]
MNYDLKMKVLQSGKSQIALAKEIGISEPYLSKIVNGWIEPKDELKTEIAKVLNCKVIDIFPENGGPKNG